MKRRNPPKGSTLILAVYQITTKSGVSEVCEKLYLYDKKNYEFWHKPFESWDWIKRTRERSLKTLEAKWFKDAEAFNGYITHLDIEFHEVGVL